MEWHLVTFRPWLPAHSSMTEKWALEGPRGQVFKSRDIDSLYIGPCKTKFKSWILPIWKAHGHLMFNLAPSDTWWDPDAYQRNPESFPIWNLNPEFLVCLKFESWIPDPHLTWPYIWFWETGEITKRMDRWKLLHFTGFTEIIQFPKYQIYLTKNPSFITCSILKLLAESKT